MIDYSCLGAMKYLWAKARSAVVNALAHDVVNTAKAAAYSGILMLFPALLVVTTLVAQVQEGRTVLGVLRAIFEQFLPYGTLEMLQMYVLSRPLRSTQLLISAGTLSILAGLGVMLSLMEGFRRAYNLPEETWKFWDKRLRALLLLPFAMLPLSVATLLVIFGHDIELWLMAIAGYSLRTIVLVFWLLARWSLATATSVSVLGLLYHFGTRRTERWLSVVPGAIAGTAIWFPTTLIFGWYVTRLGQHYTRFYGSFGAGIATLVWLYIISFSILLGAELNGVLFRQRQNGSTLR